MKCPACSIETPGPLTCTGCGALLVAANCRSCQSPMAAGVRACSNCGTRARQATFGVGLLVGVGIALAAGAGFMLASGPASPAVAPSVSAAPPPAQTGPAPQPTPRQEADLLFNNAMSAWEQGDGATAARAVPVAIAAYQRLGALDDDGNFHVGSLQLASADFAAARATAEAILTRSPNHLLALSVAARAAEGAKDAAVARGYHQRLASAYEAEVVKQLPEYRDHGHVLPIYREAAQKAVSTK